MLVSRRVRFLALAAALVLAPSCRRKDDALRDRAPSASASAAPSASAPAPALAPEVVDFARAFRELSEPTEYFFSDNLISNETSYLDPAASLVERHAGGVYLGVGPEQNFTYIALSRPELAVIVDIRRDNALLHLLYQAIFDRAESREHFLALLFGRDVGSADPVPGAGIDELLKAVAKLPADRASFERAHAELARAIGDRKELGLSADDLRSIRRMHEAFFQHGPAIRFELHEKSGRHYPTLQSLLSLVSPNGKIGSFLSREKDFRIVRQLERRRRVWFVVGDFGKPGALRRIAAELGQRKLVLRTFYVSNVEQYLFGSDAWQNWLENLEAFPADEQTVLIRAYLDQGQRHPRQRAGQRSASWQSALLPWLACERAKASKSYYQAVVHEACSAG